MTETATKNEMLRRWESFQKIPFGKRLFDLAIKLYIPYTGSMSAHVQELKPGYARVCLREHRKVRNHLRSVHAIALANLVEYTGNLALVCGMPDDARFIPKNISINYIKKARGLLTGECFAPKVESNEKREYTVDVTIKDVQGDVVVEGKLLTLVGPKK